MYIILVVFGAIIWVVLALWILKKSFKGQSIASQKDSDNQNKGTKNNKSISKKI